MSVVWTAVNKDVEPATTETSEVVEIDTSLRNRAWKDIALYGLARLGLFIVLTIAIEALALAVGAPVPLAIAALLALIVAFPLSMFVFSGLRTRVTQELYDWNQHRKAHKRWVAQQIADRE